MVEVGQPTCDDTTTTTATQDDDIDFIRKSHDCKMIEYGMSSFGYVSIVYQGEREDRGERNVGMRKKAGKSRSRS